VPWCDTCDRLVVDDDVDEGACPTCGTELVEPEPRRVSWKMRLLIVATAVYLVWRCVQGVQWLTHHA